MGLSGAKYMRIRRLNLVRASLKNSGLREASVARIARHYGFTELGRFAVEYRTVFGERPSVTLRRAQSQGGGFPAVT